MSYYYTKNFDSSIYYGQDGAILTDQDWPRDILNADDWAKWLAGKEPRFPKYLADSQWFNFTSTLGYFQEYCHGLNFDGSEDDEVFLNNYKANLRKKLEVDFSNVLKILNNVNDLKPELGVKWFTDSPFILESKLSKYTAIEYSPENYIVLMCAYSIMQCDEGITGLLENDAIKSAGCFLYSDIATKLIWETRILMTKDNRSIEDRYLDEQYVSEQFKLMQFDARSKNATKGHKDTYELKNQAIEYWRLHIDPELSNPKAADLLLKIVKVSHRKLVEYVAEARRESLPSASKV